MFRITLAHSPSLKNIHNKYLETMEQVIDWAQSLHGAFNCELSGIYIRGSVVYGTQNKHSDMDMAILLKNGASLSTILQFEDSLDALLTLDLRSFSTEIKIYVMDKKNSIEPSTNIQGILREKIKKHINFDFSANGICVWGKEIKNHLAVFNNAYDFIENNQIILGSAITRLVNLINVNPFLNVYYPLIKKCIKLSAIINFKPEIGYIAPLKSCYEYAVKNDKKIGKELSLLFNYIEKDINHISRNELKKLKKAIIIITKTILPKIDI